MPRFPRRSLAVLAAATFCGAAFAQSPRLVEVDDATMLTPWNMSAEAVEDMDVMGPSGARIGEVEEVVGPDSTMPTALVVDFEDGAGYGDRDLVVPLESFTPGNGMLTLALDPAGAAALPSRD